MNKTDMTFGITAAQAVELDGERELVEVNPRRSLRKKARNIYRSGNSNHQSMKLRYGIEKVASLEEFVEGKFYSHSLEYAREAVAKYYGSTPSSTFLNSMRLNIMISEIKKFGREVSQVFTTIHHADKFSSICLLVENEGSEIFVLIDDIKYFKRKNDLDFTEATEEDFVDGDFAISGHTTIFHKPNDEMAFDLAKNLSRICSAKNQEEASYVDMIIHTHMGLSLKAIKLDPVKDFDMTLNYGEEFPQYHEKLIERISSKTKGIVMLHGPPGTGKTHYIRSLIPSFMEMGKRVVLVPKHVISEMESPKFNSFMLDAFTNEETIFIIEDAESIITKRDGQNGHRSELVSTILNITDGILNDIFNIQVLLTFNTEINSIDEALLRKGRLISKYEFGSLNRADALRLAESLGFSLHGFKPSYTLAEIYGMKEHDEDEILINQNISKPKPFVGF